MLLLAMDMFIPKSEGNSWRRKNSWAYPIPKELKTLINQKHRLWTRLQEQKGFSYRERYKQIRNKVRKETRSLKNRLQNEVAISCKDNPNFFGSSSIPKEKHQIKLEALEGQQKMG